MCFVPLKKQSKKQKKEFYKKRRGDWNGVCPITRCVPSKKQYNRAKDKQSFEREYIDTMT